MSHLQAPDLGLYVHIPWCVRKCPYCDFNSHERSGLLPEAEYVAALLTDLERDAPAAGGREVDTVFIGGGTPSLFAASSIADLLRGVRERVAVATNAEVTLEANPGTVEHGRFAGYRDAGVTRISLGAQSFGARQLALLGRIHDAGDTAVAVGELHAAGITNFNLDLMYALPEQTLAAALADLEAATAFAPPHLSRYQLTLEPGTVFHSRPPALPNEDLADAMQQEGDARLLALGYRHYEVSAWARPGAECRHNLNYWRYGDYLGIGAGAHGKFTEPATARIVRTEKPKQPRTYLGAVHGAAPFGTRIEVPPAERPFEFMLNALRLDEGFQVRDYEARTGLSAALLAPLLEAAAGRGLLAEQPGGWRPTALGSRFLNDLQALFLPAVART